MAPSHSPACRIGVVPDRAGPILPRGLTHKEFTMTKDECDARVQLVKQRAAGRWTEILRSLTGDHPCLKGSNQGCPVCAKGKDRFRYTDKDGEGTYFCHGCGPGGPFKLLQALTGWDFVKALGEVERCVGTLLTSTQPGAAPLAERMKKLARKIWGEAVPVTPGDEVDRYLSGRGLSLPTYPDVLRFHPALGYFEKTEGGKSRKIAEYPAMLARVDGVDGEAITLHRTYLSGGRKAAVPDAKKVLSSGINGAAVRLFDANDELGVAEGIETALAVHLATGKPVWAALSAGNLEKLWLPDSVRRVCVYGDNDAGSQFDGQACAYALARRLMKTARQPPRQVEVFLPKQAGSDWADVWWARLSTVRRAA
jgi:putative DNA primase/helicase